MAFGSAALAVPVPPTPPSAYQIIEKEGRLAFTDGSSYYDFEKDGTFHSGPLGLSGRTIEGTWKLATTNDFAGTLVIQGMWSWMNGISAINDKREMMMSVYPRTGQPEKKGSDAVLSPVGVAPRRAKLRSCYFVIDELVALPKPK